MTTTGGSCRDRSPSLPAAVTRWARAGVQPARQLCSPRRPGRGRAVRTGGRAWTNNTAMALCLAESLTECGGFNAADQMRRYLRWYQEGHLSSDGRCSTSAPLSGRPCAASSVTASRSRGAPTRATAATARSCGWRRCRSRSRTTRTLPLSLPARCAHDPRCARAGRRLHGADRGCAARRAEGVPAGAVLCPAPGLWDNRPLRRNRRDRGVFVQAQDSAPAIRGTGYVVNALEAALWAFWTTDRLRPARWRR